VAGWLINGAVAWLAVAVVEVIKLLWGLLSQTAFSTPDVTGLPQVAAITGTSMMIVNVCFILAVLAAGIAVMIRGVVPSRYGVGELLPRLVVGWIAANFAVPICRNLVVFANALSDALTGGGITANDSLTRMQRVIIDALTNPASALLAVIIGLVLAVLTAMLIVTWLARLGVLVVLVGVSPVALACHASPFTDAAARLWWRALLGTLATVLVQALALHIALSVFLNPQANVVPLGIAHDPTGTFNLFLVVCVMWVVIKIPGMMRRYVTRGGGGPNVAGLIVRTVLIQQLTSVLRMPLRRAGAGRGAAAAAGARGGRGGLMAGGGTRLPQPVAGARSRPVARGDALASPRGGGEGRVGVVWPTGRPMRPYTPQEIATGVDPYTRTVKRPTPSPIRAAAPSVPRPPIPDGISPATAMPKTRPVRPPVSGPWNRPTTPR
jgi:hypothetical protein